MIGRQFGERTQEVVMKHFIFSLLAPLLFMTGCGSSETSAPAVETANDLPAAAQAATPDAESAQPAPATPTLESTATPAKTAVALADGPQSIAGRWSMQFMDNAHWIPIGLLEIQKKGDE